MPELRVIESGVLKGFVTISPKWAGFKAADYLQASMSVYTDDTYYGQPAEGDATFEVAVGDFDLRGFEVTNSSLFDANKRPYVLFQSKQIKFSTDCVRQFGKDNKVELLIHPGLRKLAVRRAPLRILASVYSGQDLTMENTMPKRYRVPHLVEPYSNCSIGKPILSSGPMVDSSKTKGIRCSYLI